MQEAAAERSRLDERIARLEIELEQQAVAEGLIENPAPQLDKGSHLYWRDFSRLCQRTISIGGMGGLIHNVALDWGHVTDWATENGLDPDFVREVFYPMRDLLEQLENKFSAEKKS